jgi:hypothetical protein
MVMICKCRRAFAGAGFVGIVCPRRISRAGGAIARATPFRLGRATAVARKHWARPSSTGEQDQRCRLENSLLGRSQYPL